MTYHHSPLNKKHFSLRKKIIIDDISTNSALHNSGWVPSTKFAQMWDPQHLKRGKTWRDGRIGCPVKCGVQPPRGLTLWVVPAPSSMYGPD